jgi:hypothetical protein
MEPDGRTSRETTYNKALLPAFCALVIASILASVFCRLLGFTWKGLTFGDSAMVWQDIVVLAWGLIAFFVTLVSVMYFPQRSRRKNVRVDDSIL